MEKFKILVVDDDANLAFLLQQRLEIEGFEVESANSVPSGYLAYQLFKPDLVLTDISMGEESGFDLMRRIRSHAPQIRTIYMTGDLSRFQAALDHERNDYHAKVLSKPFSERFLLESISEVAGTRHKVEIKPRRVRSRDRVSPAS